MIFAVLCGFFAGVFALALVLHLQDTVFKWKQAARDASQRRLRNEISQLRSDLSDCKERLAKYEGSAYR